MENKHYRKQEFRKSRMVDNETVFALPPLPSPGGAPRKGRGVPSLHASASCLRPFLCLRLFRSLSLPRMPGPYLLTRVDGGKKRNKKQEAHRSLQEREKAEREGESERIQDTRACGAQFYNRKTQYSELTRVGQDIQLASSATIRLHAKVECIPTRYIPAYTRQGSCRAC